MLILFPNRSEPTVVVFCRLGKVKMLQLEGWTTGLGQPGRCLHEMETLWKVCLSTYPQMIKIFNILARFSLFESSQSLFWASFGMVGLESFELAGIKSYTRFWGLLMFGSYCVINVIVLLNLLIAMMSNSYAMIDEHSDTEWKFARTRLWMSYFEESSTLPPPFNIFPNMKHVMRLCGKKKKRDIKRESTIVSIYEDFMGRHILLTAFLIHIKVQLMASTHNGCVINTVF